VERMEDRLEGEEVLRMVVDEEHAWLTRLLRRMVDGRWGGRHECDATVSAEDDSGYVAVAGEGKGCATTVT